MKHACAVEACVQGDHIGVGDLTSGFGRVAGLVLCDLELFCL